MNLWSHIFHLGVSERNEGAFLVWRCPQCGVERDFDLIVSQGGFFLLGLNLSKPAPMLDLRCSKCCYEFRVALSERNLNDRVGQATRRLKSGELTPQSYDVGVREIPARFVRDLLALSETWKCEKCGEANPTGFESCWNCRSKERPEVIVSEGEETPYPGMPRGGNSWE